MEYTLLKNLRKNGEIYQAGETIFIKDKDIKAMIDAGIIEIKKKKKKTTKKLEENGDIDSSNNNGKR